MTTTITVTLDLPDEVVRWLEATKTERLDDHVAGLLATAVCDAIGPDLSEEDWRRALDEQAKRIEAEGDIPF